MKIDFTKLKIKDLKGNEQVIDVKDELANQIYVSGRGVAQHDLALKIYNEEDLDDKAIETLKAYVSNLSPMMIDAIGNVIGKK